MSASPIASPIRVAVIGVGIMGSAIATRLARCGVAVSAYDRDPSRPAALAPLGVRAAANAREAARQADCVILSLNTADIVRVAVFGDAGVAQGAGPDKLLIDMSSIDPNATRTMAAQLRSATGMAWVDCPLSGGVPGAQSGSLTIMAGGDAQDFERARAVMRHLAANYTLMGAVGAGQTTKLVNQVLCAILFQAVAEAAEFAQRGGVAAEAIPAALAGGRADSRILQEFMAKMARHDYSPTGRLDNMLKDLDAVQACAKAAATPMPVTDLVAQIHRKLVAAGLGAEDNCALMRQFDDPAPER